MGYRWVQELPVHWARDLDRYLLELGGLGARDLAGLSLEELWAHVLEIDRVGREYFLPNIAISITQGLLHRLLFQMVAHVVGPADAPAVYDGLTCFSVPLTIFGPLRAAVYMGQMYFVYTTSEHIRVLTRHFDGLIRVASVQPPNVATFLRDLRRKV